MNMTSQAKLSLCFLNNLQGLQKNKQKTNRKRTKNALVSYNEMLSAQTKHLDNDILLNHLSLYTIKMDLKNNRKTRCILSVFSDLS